MAGVKALRRKIALDLGVVLPLVRTRDNIDLPASTYTIRVHGAEIARGTALPGHVLAIGDMLAGLPGNVTKEPVFGLDAKWAPASARAQAERMGATVVDPASVREMKASAASSPSRPYEKNADERTNFHKHPLTRSEYQCG